MKIKILNEKKDCFKNKTFKGKSRCIKRQKRISKKGADAYVASVLRDMGELDEGGVSSGNRGTFPIDSISGEQEFRGQKERAELQGLQNFKEVKDNVTKNKNPK